MHVDCVVLTLRLCLHLNYMDKTIGNPEEMDHKIEDTKDDLFLHRNVTFKLFIIIRLALTLVHVRGG